MSSLRPLIKQQTVTLGNQSAASGSVVFVFARETSVQTRSEHCQRGKTFTPIHPTCIRKSKPKKKEQKNEVKRRRASYCPENPCPPSHLPLSCVSKDHIKRAKRKETEVKKAAGEEKKRNARQKRRIRGAAEKRSTRRTEKPKSNPKPKATTTATTSASDWSKPNTSEAEEDEGGRETRGDCAVCRTSLTVIAVVVFGQTQVVPSFPTSVRQLCSFPGWIKYGITSKTDFKNIYIFLFLLSIVCLLMMYGFVSLLSTFYAAGGRAGGRGEGWWEVSGSATCCLLSCLVVSLVVLWFFFFFFTFLVGNNCENVASKENDSFSWSRMLWKSQN